MLNLKLIPKENLPQSNFISFLNMFLSITPSSFHKFIFSQACISHHGCEKYSNLWCSDKCRMDLQVKKLKVDISATPRKSSVTGAIITLKAETNYSFPQLRERGLKKPVLKCIVLSQHF